MNTDEHGLANESMTSASNDSTVHPANTPPLQDSNTPELQNSAAPPPSSLIPHPSSFSAESDEQAFTRLGQLTPAQFDRVRQAEASHLGIRLETLDSEVARCRLNADYDAQARAIKLPPVEPWPEPVDGQEVLHQVAERFVLRVIMPPGAPQALALWDAHAHAFRAFLHTPRLNLSSAQSECGKTTTVDLLAAMTPRALRTENLTAPVLFRLVAQHQPTLLLDEIDSYLLYTEELRGLLNAGHKQGACAYRCEGPGNGVRAFNAFGPAVLSGIGPVPDTLRSRSIRVELAKAEPEEIPARFDSRHTEIEAVLCRKLARWAQDNFTALQTCDPPMPATAYNRVADNWRPLFAIAQIAGGDWPRLALEAYHHLAKREEGRGQQRGESSEEKAESRGQRPEVGGQRSEAGQRRTHSPLSALPSPPLLASIRQIFTQTGAARISSQRLVDALNALPNSPNSALGISHSALEPLRTPHSALTARSLAACLRPFGIAPRTMRIGNDRVKGYELADFADAFARLISPKSDGGG
jgi:putative DNA primase/helicase